MGLKSKLAMALATSAAGAAMIAGGSFALFTANAGTTSNTFSAGNITLTPGVSWAASDTLNNIAPGDSGALGNVTLTNSGSLDEWVNLSVQNNGGKLFQSFTGDSNPLGVSYTATVTGASAPYTFTDANGSESITNFVPTDLQGASMHQVPATASSSSPDNEWVFLPAHSQVAITAKYSFNQAAGNDYMGATGTLTVGATAVQAKNNTKADSTNGIGAAPISNS